MRKKIKILLFVMVIVIISLYFEFVSHPVISYDKDKILNNSNCYKEVAECFLEDYRKYNSDDIFCYTNVSKEISGAYSQCVVEQFEHKVYIPDNIFEMYSKLESDFRLDKLCLSCISVYDSFVVFGIENGRASIIYSKYDEIPQYVNGGTVVDKEKDNYIEKITDNLYYACWQN